MITNIEELKSEILRRRIARKEDLMGCDDRDLESIEQRYGKLPLAYKQIMRLRGGGAEKNLSVYGDDFILARAISLNKWTDSHPIVKISKKRIDKEYSKFAGILIDVFYHHLLAKNWEIYSKNQNRQEAIVFCITDFLCKILASSIQSYGNCASHSRFCMSRNRTP
jgi:hypothetical protein